MREPTSPCRQPLRQIIKEFEVSAGAARVQNSNLWWKCSLHHIERNSAGTLQETSVLSHRMLGNIE